MTRRTCRGPLSLLAAFALLGTGGMAACQSVTLAPVPAPVTAAALAATKRSGDLIDRVALTDLDPLVRASGASVYRIRYRSSSAWGGRPVAVSAVAALPPGDPPPGGWPVVAFAHGTSGILPECAPSLAPTMLGSAAPVAGFVAKGFAVVATDYEGIGEAGTHAYLDAQAAGANVVDSVRALRALRPGAVSNRWLTVGGSQGGGAVWGANEAAAARAPELRLLGVVAMVPAADMTAYVDLAAAGRLGPDQTAAYVWMLMAQGRGRPSLDLDLYRRGSTAANWRSLSYCYGPHAQERMDALAKIVPDELKPASPKAAARLKALFAAMSLPKRRGAAPMLVLYAGRDSFIDPPWIRTAIARACAMGTPVEAIFQPDKGHGEVDIAPALEWMGHRLAGDPVRAPCRQAH